MYSWWGLGWMFRGFISYRPNDFVEKWARLWVSI